jgi:autotransporter-associated beta strand protein
MSVKGKKTVWSAAIIVASIAPLTQPQISEAKAIDLPYSVIGRYYQPAAGAVNQGVEAAFTSGSSDRFNTSATIGFLDFPSFGRAINLRNLTGSAGSILEIYPGTTFTGGILNITGAGSVTVNGSANHAGGTSVGAGTLSVDSGSYGTGTSGTLLGSGSLYKTGAGTLTLAHSPIISNNLVLNNNSLIVNYTGSSPASSIRSQLQAGYGPGVWSGTGITGSGGGVITGNAVLVKYTYPSDGNLWVTGDYNYDGVIDLENDFSIFVDSYMAFAPNPTQLVQLRSAIYPLDLTNWQKNAMLSVVPEPASVAVLAIAAGMLTLRRQREF